jgi:hypothetical protein
VETKRLNQFIGVDGGQYGDECDLGIKKEIIIAQSRTNQSQE